jgi:asparagine synthase (glutamine-hydrolysing)
VLVELIAKVGVEDAARESIGMFAFAAWDAEKRQLWLARDRFGEKPLYFARASGAFGFASELRALRPMPGLDANIDPEALSDLLRYGYVTGTKSILRGVRRLGAGTIVRIDDDLLEGQSVRYWSPSEEASKSSHRPPLVGNELLDLVSEVVRSRMVADVPLGAFLSGGIDSSLVVALMARVTSDPVKTFTIGFGSRDHDETPFARNVARALGTDHHEWILSSNDVLDVIPRLQSIYDEPFADSSQIPTVLVSALARRHVTVALSGDGGDEMFGGYDRYRALHLRSRLTTFVPSPVRSFAGRLAMSRSVDQWSSLFGRFPRVFVPSGIKHRGGERVHKIGRMLRADSMVEAYDSMITVNANARELMLAPSGSTEREALSSDPVSHAILFDTSVYLPDDILTKVDRASMANSLEVRVPLLDPRVFDAAWRIPRANLSADGGGKAPIREVLKQLLPGELIDRPKQGFGVPLAAWLRGPLRTWGDQLLDEAAINQRGLISGPAVRELWNAHQTGRSDASAELWPILMFQAWLDQWN